MELNFGSIADELKIQCKKYNKYLNNSSKHEAIRKSINILSFHGFISEKQRNRMFLTLCDEVINDCQDIIYEEV